MGGVFYHNVPIAPQWDRPIGFSLQNKPVTGLGHFVPVPTDYYGLSFSSGSEQRWFHNRLGVGLAAHPLSEGFAVYHRRPNLQPTRIIKGSLLILTSSDYASRRHSILWFA